MVPGIDDAASYMLALWCGLLDTRRLLYVDCEFRFGPDIVSFSQSISSNPSCLFMLDSVDRGLVCFGLESRRGDMIAYSSSAKYNHDGCFGRAEELCVVECE